MGGRRPEGHTTDPRNYEDEGDEQKTEKNRGVFWGRLGPRRGYSALDQY